MADIRDLRAELYEASKGWLMEYHYIDDNIVDLYDTDEEISNLVDKLMVIIKHHKGVK